MNDFILHFNVRFHLNKYVKITDVEEKLKSRSLVWRRKLEGDIHAAFIHLNQK